MERPGLVKTANRIGESFAALIVALMAALIAALMAKHSARRPSRGCGAHVGVHSRKGTPRSRHWIESYRTPPSVSRYQAMIAET